ncbi:MAG: hypothetical protein ACRC62_03795 [Microcoleus sp.]
MNTITLGSIVKKVSVTGWIGKVTKEEQFGYVDVLWAWDAAPTSVLVADLRPIEEKRKASWVKAFEQWESRPKKGKVNGTKGVSSKSRKKRV